MLHHQSLILSFSDVARSARDCEGLRGTTRYLDRGRRVFEFIFKGEELDGALPLFDPPQVKLELCTLRAAREEFELGDTHHTVVDRVDRTRERVRRRAEGWVVDGGWRWSLRTVAS